MKRLILVVLCISMILCGCATVVPEPTVVIYDVQQMDSDIEFAVPNTVVMSKREARRIAETVYEDLPLSSDAKKFAVHEVIFDSTNGTWVVFFREKIALGSLLKGGPVKLSYEVYIVIQKEDGKILRVALVE